MFFFSVRHPQVSLNVKSEPFVSSELHLITNFPTSSRSEAKEEGEREKGEKGGGIYTRYSTTNGYNQMCSITANVTFTDGVTKKFKVSFTGQIFPIEVYIHYIPYISD